MALSVLFVDDEVDIRTAFERFFANRFSVLMASNGREALDRLRAEPDVGVVVTDIRMPEMDGLELIRQAREDLPDLGFIVVSGHGEVDEILEALRLGARNYLQKPFSLRELDAAVSQEVQRFEVLRTERERSERSKELEGYLVAIGEMTYRLPNRFDLVGPMSFGLAERMAAVGSCTNQEQSNVALALMEILTNAIEHGNLGLTREQKTELKTNDGAEYEAELEMRLEEPRYRDRCVTVSASINHEESVIVVEDDGDGFDFHALPDPTNPENLFLPNGRGVMLARMFLDAVDYQGKGNVVRLIKRGNGIAS